MGLANGARHRMSSLLRLTVQEFERRYLASELARNGWNRKQTARELGISYRSLHYKLHRYGLRPPDKTVPEPISA